MSSKWKWSVTFLHAEHFFKCWYSWHSSFLFFNQFLMTYITEYTAHIIFLYMSYSFGVDCLIDLWSQTTLSFLKGGYKRTYTATLRLARIYLLRSAAAAAIFILPNCSINVTPLPFQQYSPLTESCISLSIGSILNIRRFVFYTPSKSHLTAR